MNHIISLNGIKDEIKQILLRQYKNQPNEAARSVSPKINSEKLLKIEKDNSSFRMIIVRHPFHRLLSAFRDKWERCAEDWDCTKRKDWFYAKEGSKIVQTYRKSALKKFGRDFFSKQNHFGAPIPVERRFNADSRNPVKSKLY